MADRAQLKALAHWKRVLGQRDSAELLALDERLQKLQTDPTFVELMDLIGDNREEVLEALINEPKARDAAGYARVLGFVAGLDEVRNAVQAIRAIAQNRENELSTRAEAERTGEEEDSQ